MNTYFRWRPDAGPRFMGVETVAAALVGLLLACVSAQAEDVPSQQIERAQVLRDIGEQEAQKPDRAVLPPARLDEPDELKRSRESARTQRQDTRWRDLLGSQQRERHVDDPARLGPQVRGAQNLRQQQADDLSDRILRQDREYRMQRHP